MKKYITILFGVMLLVSPAYVIADTETPNGCSEMNFDNTIVGTSKSETLRGTSGSDLIFGNGGSDTIRGFGDGDCIVTSSNAASTVYAGSGNDIVVSKGTDTVRGGTGDDQMFGDGAVSFYGQGGSDELQAEGNASYANGGAGMDTCEAGFEVKCEINVTPSPEIVPSIPAQCSTMEFDNTIVGTAKSEDLTGTSGNDLIFGVGGSDTIEGLGGDDCLVTSNNAASTVNAGDGNDSVISNGSDVVYGGKDNDTVVGDGAVAMYGNAGNDSLSAPSVASYANGGVGTDTCEAGSEVNCEVDITPTP